MHTQIHFLTYLSRSGSTYLSGLLDQYDDISVGIEADIPDGLVTGEFKINTREDLEIYIENLYLTNKFSTWNISKNELSRTLKDVDLPLDFGSMLRILLSLYFGKENNSKVWIHKNGNYIDHVKELEKLFEGSKFIFISRDPRAIFASQKRSLDSVTGKPMQSNVSSFANSYLNTMTLVERLRSKENFCLIRYEDLITNQDQVLARLLEFLGTEKRQTNPKDSYATRIPGSQSHLHENVDKGPQSDRINSWKSRITPFELHFIQSKLKRIMIDHEYKLESAQLGGLSDYFKLFANNLTYFLRRVKFAMAKNTK